MTEQSKQTTPHALDFRKAVAGHYHVPLDAVAFVRRHDALRYDPVVADHDLQDWVVELRFARGEEWQTVFAWRGGRDELYFRLTNDRVRTPEDAVLAELVGAPE